MRKHILVFMAMAAQDAGLCGLRDRLLKKALREDAGKKP